MSKIVVFASGDDADKAKKALADAGLDAQIVAATAANLLHIVIGMVGDDDDGDDDKKDKPDAEDKGDKPDADTSADTDTSTDDAGGDAMAESLGTVIVDGAEIKAVRSKAAVSELFVEGLQIGAKTTYGLNENKYSFWPQDVFEPIQRISIQADKHRTSLEVKLNKAVSEAYLSVGKDLIDLFTK